ncbi:UNVERIFIED_CONTAM: hypothetical protein FKN15_052995 [Acipenser sinensis]
MGAAAVCRARGGSPTVSKPELLFPEQELPVLEPELPVLELELLLPPKLEEEALFMSRARRGGIAVPFVCVKGRVEGFTGQGGQVSATTAAVIDNKNGAVPKPSSNVPKKSVADDLASTFSSPTALLLVVALIVTWSADVYSSPLCKPKLWQVSATTAAVIDNKNGAVPKPSSNVPKKSVADDLASTFSSPTALLLVVALIVTWSAVAVVMFDLMDYKSYVGGISKLGSDPMKVIDEVVEESTDWIHGVMSLLSDMITPDDDDDDEEEEPKKKPPQEPKKKLTPETEKSVPKAQKAPPPSAKEPAKAEKVEKKEGKPENVVKKEAPQTKKEVKSSKAAEPAPQTKKEVKSSKAAEPEHEKEKAKPAAVPQGKEEKMKEVKPLPRAAEGMGVLY